MKTNSSKRPKPLGKGNIFQANLNTVFINKIALLTGFKGRSDGKITALNLITSFMKMASKGLRSYQAWANEIALSNGKSLSKQAVEERMNAKTEKMLKSVFQKHMQIQLNRKIELCGRFNSVFLEDSTHIKLPEELASFYPGNISRGKEKSQAKIHALYDLSKNKFTFLNLLCFRNNDQSLSLVSLQFLQSGDLILRDLGFLVLSVIEKYIKKGVLFITRKSYGICVYDESGEKLSLKKYLKKKRFFDAQVLVGREKVKMRMIVLPVCSQTAAQRRRKARQDRDRRCNHSHEYYRLLGYTILLTNIPIEKSSSQEILSLYGLRWTIEIIFKSWKSCFCLEKIVPQKCKNIHRINCVIYLMLLYILLFQIVYSKQVQTNGEAVPISFIKMAAMFAQFLPNAEFINIKAFEKQIESMCRYENRKTRENAQEKYYKLAA